MVNKNIYLPRGAQKENFKDVPKLHPFYRAERYSWREPYHLFWWLIGVFLWVTVRSPSLSFSSHSPRNRGLENFVIQDSAAAAALTLSGERMAHGPGQHICPLSQAHTSDVPD